MTRTPGGGGTLAAAIWAAIRYRPTSGPPRSPSLAWHCRQPGLRLQPRPDVGVAPDRQQRQPAPRRPEYHGNREGRRRELLVGHVRAEHGARQIGVAVEGGPVGHYGDAAEEGGEKARKRAGDGAAERGEGAADKGGVGVVGGLVRDER